MNAKLRRALRKAESWLDARPVRERVMVFAGLASVLVAAWTVLLFDPLSEARSRVKARVLEVRAEIEQLESQGREIKAAHETDPNDELRERIAGLREQVESLDARIREHTVTMVPPQAMARFLEELLLESDDLRLVRLENLGAEPMLEDPEAREADAGGGARTGVFKHGFEVEFRGRYLSTLRYLEALEELPWNFFWEGMAYEVDEYPEGRAVLRAYTLSSQEGWVGA